MLEFQLNHVKQGSLLPLRKVSVLACVMIDKCVFPLLLVSLNVLYVVLLVSRICSSSGNFLGMGGAESGWGWGEGIY